MKGTISRITDPFGTKTSKKGTTYSAMRADVDLETGETVSVLVFDEKEVGELVELEKKGEYWNVIGKKQIAENEKHNEIMDALRKLYEMHTKLYKVVTGEDASNTTTKTTSPPAKPEKLDETIYDIPEEVNLNDIPF